MEYAVEVRDVSFTYGACTTASLRHVNLRIEKGDFFLLTGTKGCGKSTLLKMFNGLIPHESGGIMQGDVVVMGNNVLNSSIVGMSQYVGMVFQSPDDQIFSSTVADEVAFVLENKGVERKEIEARVDVILRKVGLEGFGKRSIHGLSGGQKQRLALAAILVACPSVLVLDEPISQLDPQGATDLLTVVERLNREQGITIILVEHRLHEVMPLCRHVAIMHEGEIVWQGTREQAYCHSEVFTERGLRVPHAVELCRRLAVHAPSGLSVDAVRLIREKYHLPPPYFCANHYEQSLEGLALGDKGSSVIDMRNVSFQYQQKGAYILRGINLKIYQGEFIALMGQNGAGKSTLLQTICGLLLAKEGQVFVNGKTVRSLMPGVGFIMQNPDLMLCNLTVQKELAFAMRQRCAAEKQATTQAQLIAQFGLGGLENRFPLALSRGQRFRVAIAAGLAMNPSVMLLDEPTTGQDIGHIRDVAYLLQEYAANGGTVIFCTHDAEVAAEYAERIIVMRQGEIILDGTPEIAFANEQILGTTGVKRPQIIAISQSLYGKITLTVKEAAACVRQISLGSST